MTPPHGSPTGNAADFVQLVRTFLTAYEEMSEVFEEFGPNEIPFESIRRLVGDDESSVLYRLKERSHMLFRSEGLATEAVRREALFDLAVGSLFHEAMKLRENLYQRDVYAPRIDELRQASDDESGALFAEFDRILATSNARSNEVVSEVRILLVQTRDQLRRLLIERAGDRIVTRCLLSRRAEVDASFPEGFDGLLEAMHGDAVTGLIEASRALLESAYYVEALKTLREAARRPEAPRAEIDQLETYAEGMQAFLDGDYRRSLSMLEAWAEIGAQDQEREFARIAGSVLGRLGRIVEQDVEGTQIASDAKTLQLRLETGSV